MISKTWSAGLWRLADPKISLASIASMFLGACCAAAEGSLHWPWLAATLAGIFFLEVAKNASGEIFDFDSGADLRIASSDRSPFSGGKRVLVDQLLTRGETWTVAIACYLLSITTGVAIAVYRAPEVLWLGLAGTALAYFYQGKPLQLSYRGLGEIAVAICYGPLIATGTYLVQRGHISTLIAALSIPLGLLIAAFLWINEFPDYAADRESGKRTLVVRLGRRVATWAFAAMLMAALGVLPLIAVIAGRPALMLGWVALPTAWKAARLLRRHHDETRLVIPAQAQTLLTFLLYAAGAGSGCLL